MDTFSADKRSDIMRRVLSRDTRPEIVVRSLAHRMGYRFRLHGKGIPGTPDLVFAGRNKLIFVHGCFWHRHRCRGGRALPEANREYWTNKFDRNRRRDVRVRRQLRREGWRVLVVWECQTRPERLQSLAARLQRFLDS